MPSLRVYARFKSGYKKGPINRPKPNRKEHSSAHINNPRHQSPGRYTSFDGYVQHSGDIGQSLRQSPLGMLPRRRLETWISLAVASTLIVFYTMDYTVFHRGTSNTTYLSNQQVQYISVIESGVGPPKSQHSRGTKLVSNKLSIWGLYGC